jgi:hypothetical protein
MRCAAISAVTIPVGTANVPQPMSIMKDAIKRPKSVFGTMSPKPTSVIFPTTLQPIQNKPAILKNFHFCAISALNKSSSNTKISFVILVPFRKH